MHDPVVKAADVALDREVAFQLGADLTLGARELIGQLLARAPGVVGLTHLALGTSAAAPGGITHALRREIRRFALDQGRVAYDQPTRSVVVDATIPATTDRGGPVRELGLIGGDPAGRLEVGYLVERVVIDPIAADRVVSLAPHFVLRLGAATTAAVPELTTGTLAAARAALAAADLALGRVAEAPDTNRAAGQVLAQGVAAGTVVPQATPIDVTVSSGDVIAVPPTVGLPITAAQRGTRSARPGGRRGPGRAGPCVGDRPHQRALGRRRRAPGRDRRVGCVEPRSSRCPTYAGAPSRSPPCSPPPSASRSTTPTRPQSSRVRAPRHDHRPGSRSRDPCDATARCV